MYARQNSHHIHLRSVSHKDRPFPFSYFILCDRFGNPNLRRGVFPCLHISYREKGRLVHMIHCKYVYQTDSISRAPWRNRT